MKSLIALLSSLACLALNAAEVPLAWDASSTVGVTNITLYASTGVLNTNTLATATADCTLTLPSCAAVGNWFPLILKAKTTVSTAVEVDPAGADTIDGASGPTGIGSGFFMFIVSDGVSDWEIISFLSP